MAVMDDLYLETRDKLEKANNQLEKMAEALSWLMDDANDLKCRANAEKRIEEYYKSQEVNK